MKKSLSVLILLTAGLAWVSAQDATTLQVAPSDQVRYPDASQILNKAEPKPAAKPAPAAPAASPAASVPAASTVPAAEAPKAAPLPSAKPLVAGVPVPARKAPAAPAPAPAAAPASSGPGWYLRWEVAGDEAGARDWAQKLGREFRLNPAGEGRWEVLVGPLDAGTAPAALQGQAGIATLVKR